MIIFSHYFNCSPPQGKALCCRNFSLCLSRFRTQTRYSYCSFRVSFILLNSTLHLVTYFTAVFTQATCSHFLCTCVLCTSLIHLPSVILCTCVLCTSLIHLPSVFLCMRVFCALPLYFCLCCFVHLCPVQLTYKFICVVLCTCVCALHSYLCIHLCTGYILIFCCFLSLQCVFQGMVYTLNFSGLVIYMYLIFIFSLNRFMSINLLQTIPRHYYYAPVDNRLSTLQRWLKIFICILI